LPIERSLITTANASIKMKRRKEVLPIFDGTTFLRSSSIEKNNATDSQIFADDICGNLRICGALSFNIEHSSILVQHSILISPSP
jgi:hypothetical protein